MLVYAPDADTASRIDTHAVDLAGDRLRAALRRSHAPLAAETPVLIASGEDSSGTTSAAQPGASGRRFSSASRGCSKWCRPRKTKANGRAPLRFYQERGYEITNHDLRGKSNE